MTRAKIFAVARAELNNLFFSPVSWILILSFIVLTANRFLSMLQEAIRITRNDGSVGGLPLTDYIFQSEPGLFALVEIRLEFFIPLITMGLISREISSGSIKLLQSSPLTVFDIVLGKYLASIAFLLLMLTPLWVYFLLGFFTVEAMDAAPVLVGMLGLFLLSCAYAAIGLFASSLTRYQIAAALGTFIILMFLRSMGSIGQRVPFLSDITYWLWMVGRAQELRSGLIATDTIVYFISISFLFVGLTIMRLAFQRVSLNSTKKAIRYCAYSVVVVLFGFVFSIPSLVGYVDATRGERNSLSQGSQRIMEQINGTWQLSTYGNFIGRFADIMLPQNRNRDFATFEQYTRFNPKLEIDYTLYYADTENQNIYINNPGLSNEEIAKRRAARERVKFDRILPVEALNEDYIDFEEEGYRFNRVIKWDGRAAILRAYDDMRRYPEEAQITNALATMLYGAKHVLVVEGQGERSSDIEEQGSWMSALTQKTQRSALVNYGFEFFRSNLIERVLPEDVDLMIIAGPIDTYSETQLSNIRFFIEAGGNTLITVDPDSVEAVEPILDHIGLTITNSNVEQNNGENISRSVVFARLVEPAVEFGFDFPSFAQARPIRTERSVALKHFEDTALDIEWQPLLEPTHDVSLGGLSNDALNSDSVSVDDPLAMIGQRTIGGTEQRLVVVGDSDFMIANGVFRLRTNNRDFIYDMFRYLSDGLYPIDTSRAEYKDVVTKVDLGFVDTARYVLAGIFPLLVGAYGLFILIMRRRY